MSFVGGQALSLPIWVTSVEYLRNKGVYYDNWVTRAVTRGCVTLTDSFYYSKQREFYVFNKKKYKTFREIDEKYPRGKNYVGITQYPDEAASLISKQLDQQIIRVLTPNELLDTDRVFNPINVVYSGKPRLIIHTKINSCYTRPKVTLPKITNSTDLLREAHSAFVHDLKSSYYQILLDPASRKVCSFFHDGVGYECLCLPFGSSPAVLISQTLLGIPAQIIRVRDQRVVFHFIDDYFLRNIDPEEDDVLKPELAVHGLVLSDKSQRGSQVEFLGLDLNLFDNTFTVKERTLKKIQQTINDSLILDQGRLWITVEDMESLLGLLNFATDCSIYHRTNVTHLVQSFRVNSQQRNGFCLIDSHCYKEILYWREFCLNPVRKPFDHFKPQLVSITASTDASMKTYAYQDSTGVSGHGTFPPLLIAECPDIMGREAFGSRRYLEICDKNIDLLEFCDSEPFVASFNKGRSNNIYVNRELNTIYDLLYLKNINLRLVWINTQQMIDTGTDGLSRSDFSAIHDKNGLSPEGVDRFVEIYGRKPAVDVFSSICNNPFKIDYASKHQADGDPNYLGMEGLTFLTSELLPQYCAGGYVYMWPPLELLEWIISALVKRSFKKFISIFH